MPSIILDLLQLQKRRSERQSPDLISPAAASPAKPTSLITPGTISSGIANLANNSLKSPHEEGAVTSRTEQEETLSPVEVEVEDGVARAAADAAENLMSAQMDAVDAVDAESESEASHKSAPSDTPEEWAAALWDDAYDGLKVVEPKLMHSYESAVSICLAQTGGPDLPLKWPSAIKHIQNDIAQADSSARRAQMSNFLKIWLDNPDWEESSEFDQENDDDPDEEKESDTNIDEARSLQDILRGPIQMFPHVSLSWVATYLALESLLHPVFRPEAAHSPVISVVSRMEWYISLSKIFFWPGRRDESPWRTQADALIGLYQAILSYEIHVVCLIPENAGKPRRPLEPSQLDTYANEIQNWEEALVASFDQHELKTRLVQLLDIEPAAEDETTKLRELLAKLHVDEQPFPDLPTDDGNAPQLLYEWVRSIPEYEKFIDWRAESSCGVLWVHGAAGAGKSMLLRAAVHRLSEQVEGIRDSSSSKKVAYYFCDIGRLHQGDAISAVKSLISHVLNSQPDLQNHLSLVFDTTDREHFDNSGDFYAMSTVLYNMIQDPRFSPTYFVVDTIEQLAVDGSVGNDVDSASTPGYTDKGGPKDLLDEWGLNDLLVLISTTVKLSGKIKWLLSLDTEMCDELKLGSLGERTQLRITINSDSKDVRRIAHKYAASRLAGIADKANYGGNLREIVTQKFQEVSPGNFLWLKMALDMVKSTPFPWNIPDMLDGLGKRAPDVRSLYETSRESISTFGKHDKIYCEDILSAMAVAYRPLLVSELVDIVNLPQEVNPAIIIGSTLSPFLEIWDSMLYFTHRAAKVFIRQKTKKQGVLEEHSKMTRRCLAILRRSLDGIQSSGKPMGTAARTLVDYTTVFWIRHLSELGDDGREEMAAANHLLEGHLIQWLTLLDSQDLLPKALDMMAKLNVALTAKTRQPIIKDVDSVLQNIREVTAFMRLHQVLNSSSIHQEPNPTGPQSTLLFCPSNNPLRQRLLPKCCPWLVTPPILESKDVSNSSMHVMAHSDWVRGCCFSPDGRLVASSSDEGCVRLWDTETGKLQKVLDGFHGYVYCVVMSRTGPDGSAILAASDYDTIMIWEATTCRLLNSVAAVTKAEGAADEEADSPENDESNMVLDITITTAGDRLAAAVGNAVTVWEIPDVRKVSVWPARTVRRVRFSPNGDFLALTAGSEITILEAKTGQPLRNLPERDQALEEVPGNETAEALSPGHSQDIDGLDFSPDSSFLASGSDDTTARIWDVTTGKTLAVLDYHDQHVNSVSFSSDGTRLATASTDKTIGIWRQKSPGDWGSGEVRTLPDQILSGHTKLIWSVSFAPHNNLLASVSNDGGLRIWDTDMGEETTSEAQADQSTMGVAGPGHRQPVTCVAISRDGNTIASASYDGVICLWDGKTGVRRRTMDENHGGEVKSLAFSREAKYLISASTDFKAFVWDLKSTEAIMKPEHQLDQHTDWLRDATISPNEQLVATASDDRTVRVWDISASKTAGDSVPVNVFRGHRDYIYSVAFSPDGTRLVSAGDDCHVMIWNLAGDGMKQEDKEVPDRDMSDPRVRMYIRGAVFSADGSKVVSVSTDGAVAIWSPDLPVEMQCRMVVQENTVPGPFVSMRIDEQHPNVLLTEFGAWGFDIGNEAIENACIEVPTGAAPSEASSTAMSNALSTASSPLPRLEHPPAWAPLGISEANRWITWNNRNLISLPERFRPASGTCSCRVQGHSVVVGCSLGQVLLFRFSEDMCPKI